MDKIRRYMCTDFHNVPVLSESSFITWQHVPVKGGRCLWLPLHVKSVEVNIIQSPSYPILPVPLEAVYQRPGRVSNHIHSIYDDRCATNTDRGKSLLFLF